jgi:hypothetical protein
MDTAEFERVVELYHRAAGEFTMADPEPYKALFSQRDDVTLGNPFGPVGARLARGCRHGGASVSPVPKRGGFYCPEHPRRMSRRGTPGPGR